MNNILERELSGRYFIYFEFPDGEILGVALLYCKTGDGAGDVDIHNGIGDHLILIHGSFKCRSTAARSLCDEKILIKQSIPKDSNNCFDFLAVRLRSKDLKHLIPGTGPPGLQG